MTVSKTKKVQKIETDEKRSKYDLSFKVLSYFVL